MANLKDIAKIGLFVFLAFPISSSAEESKGKNTPIWQPFIFTRKINNDELKMRSDIRHAGAFSSMIYRGQQYIDDYDHGRLFQGAIAFNNRFECDNPTQAGASRDEGHFLQRSTSKRKLAIRTAKGYKIRTQMAYWMRHNQKCNLPDGSKSPADNTKDLSDVYYNQEVSFDYPEHQNIATIKIKYELPQAQKSAVVEALTNYSPTNFTHFETFDQSGIFKTIENPEKSDEKPVPVIMATEDGKSAIGFYSKTIGATYGHWKFPMTSKISLVYRPFDVAAGERLYEAFWIIGNIEEVRESMRFIRSQIQN